MNASATLKIEGKTYELPIVVGSEGERALDVTGLRRDSGYITLDPGYANTGSCLSAITFIDGERGILRYRGIPVEQLAGRATFIEVAFLIIFGRLPAERERRAFSEMLSENEMLHEDLKFHFEGFPANAHPMAILSAMINANSCFFPELLEPHDPDKFRLAAARLLSQVRTIAAFTYRKSRGLPVIYPDPSFPYTKNLLHMMFSEPRKDYEPDPEIVRSLELILSLHADHEQNCSTSTVRMVASSQANLFASVAAGVCALWGALHGGANQAVIEMLEGIRAEGGDVKRFIGRVKDRREGIRLMGFGHRVYKNRDPRAAIIMRQCGVLLKALRREDPLLDIARELEEAALRDEYFVGRRLYPNVDFYSGIMLRAIGIPVNMFTVMFAIGRMPGWIAHYKELVEDPGVKIYRPRQIYTGPTLSPFVAPADRPGP